MKKRTIILNLFVAILLLATSNDVFAGRTAVRILHISIEQDRPRARTEPIICTADKDAGYVELLFRANLGEVEITLADSTGDVVDEISLNTSFEDFATLKVPNADDCYIPFRYTDPVIKSDTRKNSDGYELYSVYNGYLDVVLVPRPRY